MFQGSLKPYREPCHWCYAPAWGGAGHMNDLFLKFYFCYCVHVCVWCMHGSIYMEDIGHLCRVDSLSPSSCKFQESNLGWLSGLSGNYFSYWARLAGPTSRISWCRSQLVTFLVEWNVRWPEANEDFSRWLLLYVKLTMRKAVKRAGESMFLSVTIEVDSGRYCFWTGWLRNVGGSLKCRWASPNLGRT